MADNTIAQLNTDIADIAVTASGLIENTTLNPILALISNLLASHGIFQVADATALQQTNPSEGITALILGEGLYTYDSAASSGTYPAIGGGYWILQETAAIASLLDVVLTSPANGQVLAFNSSTGKWENTNQSVANIGWANVSGKPTTISGYGITDTIIKKWTHSVGVAEGSNGSIRLEPLATTVSGSVNSNAQLAALLTNAITLLRSVILSTATSVHTTPSQAVSLTDSLIIGDPGDLDVHLTSNAATGLIAIGVQGLPSFILTPTGRLHINGYAPFDDGGTRAVNIHGRFGPSQVDGVFVNNSWTTGGRPGSPQGGEQGFNSTTQQMEYYTGTGWISY